MLIMKLEKLELSALLGLQARNRELMFMMEQVRAQLEQLNDESVELFSDIEIRLELEPNTLDDYDVDVQTGELIKKEEQTNEFESFGDTVEASNGFKNSAITELKDVD